MATKKTAAEAVKEEILEAEETELKEEAKAEAAEPEAKTPDSWEEMVEIIVPRRQKGEDQFYYVCVNDRKFYIPADGRRQKMPKPISEILLASVEAEYSAQDFAEQMSRHAMEGANGIR